MSRDMIFLYRIKDSDDRDCCAYIEDKVNDTGRITLHGSCYCGSEYEEYDNIETILTREEYEMLIDKSNARQKLGYNINKESDKYNEWIELCEQIESIYDKLKSDEAMEFFEEIQESEKEILMEEHPLDEEDIEKIWNEYPLYYRDRSIVGTVFEDAYDCGYEEAWGLGYVKGGDYISEKYFDFEKFGQDLVDENEAYLELSNGSIVYLMM